MRWKSRVRLYLALVSSSTRMPRRTHRGWPNTIPYNIHKEIGCHPTQFGDFICLICVSTFQMLVQQGSTDAGLNRHRRRLPPWSSKYQIRPLILLPIQYSSFSPNCPLSVSNYANHLIILLNHIGPSSVERALLRADSNHSPSTDSLHN
jgi:hypothetical protein